MAKFNPVRICSCKVCRNGNLRRFYFHVANKKLRHKQKNQLKQFDISNLEDFVLEDRVWGGYTD